MVRGRQARRTGYDDFDEFDAEERAPDTAKWAALIAAGVLGVLLVAIAVVLLGRSGGGPTAPVADVSPLPSAIPSASTSPDVASASPQLLPVPQLVYMGSRNYRADDRRLTAYEFEIANWADFPTELFDVTEPEQTCLVFRDPSSDVEVDSQCSLAAPADLARVSFSLPRREPPPASVLVELSDPRSGQMTKSAATAIVVAVAVTPTPTASAQPTASPTAPPTPTPTPGIPVDTTIDAALARCPTAAEIALVDSRITMTFVDDPTAPVLVCRAADGSADMTFMQERAYQAVLAMRRIKFDKPLPWTNGQSMFRWFTRTVSGIRFEDVENSYCCFREREIVVLPGVVSYAADVWWVSSDTDACYYCGLYSAPGLLAHEARHAEGWYHTCGYDDQTFDEMGAWAVHKLWFVWLAEHANGAYMRPVDAPPDFYSEAARWMAGTYDSRFCTPP